MRRTISRIKKFIKDLYSKFFHRNKRVTYIRTYSYFTFDDYLKYECSYFTLPTNFEKCKDFNGNLIEIKEGCKQFDETILNILKDDKLKNYIKFK